MTRALFTVTDRSRDPDGTVRLRLMVSGHAGYAPAGQDIVCAAASILAEALAAALERECEKGLTMDLIWERSLVVLTADCTPQQYPRVRGLYDTALAGYRLLALHYPANVSCDDTGKNEFCTKDGGTCHED